MRRLLVACLLLTAVATAAGVPAHANATTACRLDQFRFSFGSVDGGMGRAGLRLIFRNEGQLCTVEGYPTVTGTDTPVDLTTMRASQTPKGYLGGASRSASLPLRRGASASALFEGVLTSFDPYNSSCPPYDALQIELPGVSGMLSVNWPWWDYWFCQSSVHPLVRGSSGGAYAPDPEPVRSDRPPVPPRRSSRR